MAGPPFTEAEEARIAWYMAAERGASRKDRKQAEALVTAGRPTPPKEVTPTERKRGSLDSALKELGIDLSDKEFPNFLAEVRQDYQLQVDRGRYEDSAEGWAKYLQDGSQRPVTVPQTLPGELVGAPEIVTGVAPLQTLLEQWQADQEALREVAALLKRQAARLEAEAEGAKFRADLNKAQLKDALADLKRRYPNNKNVIDALGAGNPALGLPSAFETAWSDYNARAKDEIAGLPPELQEFVSQGAPGVSIDAFVRSLDLGQFAADEGLGDFWQDGMLKDAIQRQVYDPILAAAKTPQDKLSAERKIAQLQGSYAGLKRQFDFAQQQDPTVTADGFMAGDGAGLVAQMRANNQAQVNEQIKALAAKGQSRAQIAAQLTLGPADFTGTGADALREGENIAAQIKKAEVLKKNADNVGAARAYASAISQLDPRTTGSAEDIARSLGTTIPALQELQGSLGPDVSFMQYLTDTAAQNRQLNLVAARASIGPANTLPILQRAVAAGVMSADQAKALIASGQNLDSPLDITFMQNDPRNFPKDDPRYSPYAPVNPMGTTLAQNIEAATEQARTADVYNRWNFQVAQGAQDVSAGAQAIRDIFTKGGTVFDVQSAFQAREEAGYSGASEQQFQMALLFSNPEFRKFLEGVSEREASSLANELARFSNANTGARFPERLASPELYIRSQLGRLGTEFQGFQKQQALTKLAPIQADKTFAPTLTQLLTDFGLRKPGVSREDLLAQNADAIKKTYDEYLRRSSGAQGQGSFTLAQQRQAIGGGIL